jgi:hypothetical protein
MAGKAEAQAMTVTTMAVAVAGPTERLALE